MWLNFHCRTEQAGSSDNTSDLYSGGTRFESQYIYYPK
jgi:hypothetical protein